jgi:hypothetical protein
LVKHLFVCLLAAAAISLTARDAAADEFKYTFQCITDNNASDCSVLETQLSVTIGLNATNSSMVDFLFQNSGPAASSIADVYFDDPIPRLLGNPAIITQSNGVSFSAGCNPGNVPGGNLYGFTTAYCADSNNPMQPNGVNPGEWLRLSYTLQGNATLLDVLNAIAADSYNVGIHVQGLGVDGQGSESGIMHLQPVPEPASILLLGGGAAAAFIRRRRRLAA